MSKDSYYYYSVVQEIHKEYYKEYEKLRVEQVILKAKKGDRKAREYLNKKYYKQVLMVASNYYLESGDRHDLIQEGLIGLNQAIDAFEPKKNGKKFKNFVRLCAKRKMLTLIKKHTRKKHKVLSDSLSMNYQSEDFEDGPYEDENFWSSKAKINLNENPENKLIDQIEYYNLNFFLQEELSDLEFSSLNAYLSNLSYEEIAKKLGIKEKSVDNALTRVKYKLETKYPEYDFYISNWRSVPEKQPV